MEIRFVLPDLQRLDELKSEAVAVPVFEDERPLRGAAGLFDWRLCGRISRLIVQGRVTGEADEKVLLPSRPRLPFDKLFLFGMGASSDFDHEVFSRAVETMLTTLTEARVRSSSCVLPGRALGLISGDAAMDRFLEVAGSHSEHDEITLIESADDQKVMLPLLEKARRRARAGMI